MPKYLLTFTENYLTTKNTSSQNLISTIFESRTAIGGAFLILEELHYNIQLKSGRYFNPKLENGVKNYTSLFSQVNYKISINMDKIRL